MPGICRDTTDTAGAALIKTKDTVFINGDEVIVHGDTVTAHLSGEHAAPPTMIAGSKFLYVDGILVCNAGDLATCGHAATGSANTFVGD